MNRDYKISNDGTIFEIKDDGSIAKLAKIDDKGQISTLSGTVMTANGGSKGGYWFFIVLFAIAAIILGVMYAEADEILNNISDEYPLIITDIKIGNVYKNDDIQTDYGKRIYDYNTMYLKPKISYIGLTSGTKTFKVKWYNSDGTIRRGSSSPSGFTFSDDVYISEGTNNSLTLLGWGNTSKGHWRSGTYRIEIWYKNTCLKTQTFEIY